jgi:lipoprotein-anchoring transpeptidase ErfK/SrfK
VLLDRAHFSPGVVDGRPGENFEKALRAYQQQNGLEPSGRLDEATWQSLGKTSQAPAVVEYTIANDDVKGPFVRRIPHDFRKMALLGRLAYKDPRERISEHFHMDEGLLAALNAGTNFRRAGSKIVVANVLDDRAVAASSDLNVVTAGAPPQNRAVDEHPIRIEVSKSEQVLRVFRDGKLIAFYPATVGSEEKPAPEGATTVRRVVRDPTYRYDPDYKFKGQKAKQPVEIASGPNNPVGAVWIALSVKGYGIHGTPTPAAVGKTESNGCVRLTNWDALALAKLVKKDTEVLFKE